MAPNYTPEQWAKINSMPFIPVNYDPNKEEFDSSLLTRSLPMSIEERNSFLLKNFGFAAGLYGIYKVGQHDFGAGKRGWDYIVGGIRSIEERSPGKVFRTFQISQMMSPLEQASRQTRFISHETLKDLGTLRDLSKLSEEAKKAEIKRYSAGKAWLKSVEDLLPEDKYLKISKGLRFEGGKLFAGEELLLEHAGIVSSPYTDVSPHFQTAYTRSLAGGPVKNVNQAFKLPIKFTNTAGVEEEAAFMIAGGKTKSEFAKRYLFGYGTSLIERLNRLASAPIETPLLKDIPLINKINLGVVPSSGLKTLGKLSLKLGIGIPAAVLGYQQLDYWARESKLLDNTVFSEGITAGIARVGMNVNLGMSKAADVFGLHTYREKQEEIAPKSTSLLTLAGFPLAGGLAGLTAGYFGIGQRGIGGIAPKIGAAVGAAMILPFLPGALIPSKRPEELERLYSGEEEVAVRKGAKWLLGRSEYEGCLTEDSLILLPNGTRKEIKDIKKGDYVFNQLGNITKVIDVAKRYVNEKVYLINSAKEKETILKLTGNHEILVSKLNKCLKKSNELCSNNKRIGQKCKNCINKDNNISLEWIPVSKLTKEYRLFFPFFNYENEIKFINTIDILPSGYIVENGYLFTPHFNKSLFKEEQFLLNQDLIKYNDSPKKQKKIIKKEIINKFHISENYFRNKKQDIKKVQKKGGIPGFNKRKKISSTIDFTKDFGKLMGYYASEGSCGNNCVRFAFNKNEDIYINETVYLLRKLFGEDFSIKIWKDTQTNSATVVASSIFFPILFSYLCPGTAKNKNKQLNSCLMFAPIDFVRGFLETFVNGDGSAKKDYCAFIIGLSCPILINQISLLFGRIKVFATQEKSRQAGKDKKFTVYDICVTGLDAEIAYKQYDQPKDGKHFANYFSNRKIRLENGTLSEIHKLSEEYYEGYVYDLQVEEESSFLTPGLCLHNSYITRYRKHFYQRLINRSQEESIWGEDIWGEKMSPIKRWWKKNFTYDVEQRLYDRYKFPISSPAFTDVPIIGPLLSSTIGKIVKPQVRMHEEEWVTETESGKEGFIPAPTPPGTIVNPEDFTPGKPINPYGLKGTIHKQVKQFENVVGFPGWIWSLVRKGLGYENQEQELASAEIITSPARNYWDEELGDIFGSSELIRRLYPTYQKQRELYNPIPNQFANVSWLPGDEDKVMNFKRGSPYTNITAGEERLPGPGIEKIYPQLKGLDPNNYPLIFKYKILSDVAIYSDKFKTIQNQARVAAKTGQFNEQEMAMYDQIKDQVKAKKDRTNFTPYKWKERARTPMEEILAAANESQKDNTTKGSWFDRTVGRYWETITHNAELPTEFLTPLAPAHKLIHARTAVEDYEKMQVYGRSESFWDSPYEYFIKPFMNRTGRTLGWEGIPKEVQEVRDTEEYFDILKYMKAEKLGREAKVSGDYQAAAQYEEEKNQTLVGMNPYARNYTNLFKALPRRDRNYFSEFIKADMEEREQILEMIPENQKALMTSQWQLKDLADFNKAKEKGLLSEEQIEEGQQTSQKIYENIKTEGLPKDEKLWNEYLDERQEDEEYPDWYRRAKLIPEQLKRLDMDIPGPDYVGFCLPKFQSLLDKDYNIIYPEQIKLGTKILTNNGEGKVMTIYKRDTNLSDQMMKITIVHDSYHSMHATSNHFVLAIKGNTCKYNFRSGSICTQKDSFWKCDFCETKFYQEYIPVWIPIKELDEHYFLVIPKITHENSNFKVDLSQEFDYKRNGLKITDDSIRPLSGIIKSMKRFIEIDESIAWLAGYYLAEGNIWQYRSKGKENRIRGVQFSAAQHETPLLELAAKIIKEKFGLTGRIYQRNRRAKNGKIHKSAYLVVASGAFGSLFYSWMGAYSDKKYPPYWISKITQQSQIAFLDGIMQGDCNKNEQERLGMTSYKVVFMVKCLFESLGIPVSFSKKTKSYRKSVYFVQKIKEAHGFINKKDYVAYKIKKLETIQYNEELFDFEVDPQHCYRCEIGIYHNSPNVNLEDIKLKVVLNEGKNNFDYNFWQNQILDIKRKPYLTKAAEQIEEAMDGLKAEDNPEAIKNNIERILSSNDVRGTVSIAQLDGNTSSNHINIQIQENRSKSSEEEIKRVYKDVG